MEHTRNWSYEKYTSHPHFSIYAGRQRVATIEDHLVDSEEIARLIVASPAMKEAGHNLAMLALQSDRYTSDPDYRDAVDNWLTVEKLAKGGN